MTVAATEAVRALDVVELGTLEYGRALDAAGSRVGSGGGRWREKLLLVEHPAVYTIGRGGDEANLRGAPERLGVPLFRVSRGGDATFHGPGQLVAYPILSLDREGRDLHRYLRRLEDVLIRTLADFGISGNPSRRQDRSLGRGTQDRLDRRRRASLGDLPRRGAQRDDRSRILPSDRALRHRGRGGHVDGA